MEFSSLSELKERVKPALVIKEEYFKSQGLDITIEDIWYYLKINKWVNSKNLTLNEIVNDILKLGSKDININ